MRGRHDSCHLVDYTPSHLRRPSMQLASDSVDRRVSVGDYALTQAGKEAVEDDTAVAEAAGDITSTAKNAFGKISELCLVDVVCQMTSILNTMLTAVIILT